MAATELRSNCTICALTFIIVAFAAVTLTACSRGSIMKPDFDKALQSHLDAIVNRDIEAFKSNLTHGEKLYTIVQNGHAFTTRSVEIHEQWFKDPNWIWEGSVVHKVVGQDMAMALVEYQTLFETSSAAGLPSSRPTPLHGAARLRHRAAFS